jgi:hypothetical protein
MCERILAATTRGECCQVIGLSGSGKSNLAGFLCARKSGGGWRLAAVDCNRLAEHSPAGLYALIAGVCRAEERSAAGLVELATCIEEEINRAGSGLCLVFDRFDKLMETDLERTAGNLRWLRDQFKYRLTYTVFTRRRMQADNELAELFFANTMWLGGLDWADSRWSISQFAARHGLDWDEARMTAIFEISRGYPAMLRAVCQAVADGCGLEPGELQRHPAVAQRIAEFWAAQPAEEELASCGLVDHPLLGGRGGQDELTAKEALLLAYLQAHPGVICDKDDIIRAVWAEDRIFTQGVRDDSLAQLVRRLRRKIEADPSRPQHLITVTGRGYRFIP